MLALLKTFVRLLPSSVCDSILVTEALKLFNNINFRHIWNKPNHTKACLYPLMPSQQSFLTYLKISKIYHSPNYVAHVILSNLFLKWISKIFIDPRRGILMFVSSVFCLLTHSPQLLFDTLHRLEWAMSS